MLIDLLIILALALLNGLFAMAEIALVSSNKPRLNAAANRGDKRAARALELANSPSRFLATVQIGITVVGIGAGVFGGAAIASDLAAFLGEIAIPSSIAEPLAFGIVVIIITYASLVLGELVPKQFGLSYPEEISKSLAGFLILLGRIFAPVVWFLDSSTALLTRVVPIRLKERRLVSEEDIRALLLQSAASGEIARSEREMVERVFLLDDRPVQALMTHRRDVVWLDLDESMERNWETAIGVPHSFFPVARGSLDSIVGFISMKELSVAYTSAGKQKLEDFIRSPLIVVAGVKASNVLELFKRERRHMAVVVNEYGDVEGVVTTHDLLEAIVGDIGDYEGQERDIFKRPDGSYLIDAGLDVQELFILLSIHPPEQEPGSLYHSVGGFVVNRLKRLPSAGDSFAWNGYRFEVVDVDQNRIDKILVTRLQLPESAAEQAN